MMSMRPDSRGRFGEFGGRYVPETVMPALEALAGEFERLREDARFNEELGALRRDYAGRPTALYEARRLTEAWDGARVFLKREDLAHTGAHKINNTIGQALLAREMKKERLIAETGAGQHGVATATVAALFGFRAAVFMGAEDMRRQAPNVLRMRLLGAEVIAVTTGSATLKDATSEAIRDWVATVRNTHYVIGSTVGPHPYPEIVAHFQRVIGEETRAEFLRREGRLPDCVVAAVGGGSNALGIFLPFVDDDTVALVGVEAGGRGAAPGEHAASLTRGSPGVLHGAMSYLLQDADRQVIATHSISAGLDYPGVGPQHSHLKTIGRARYETASDTEALDAFCETARLEGILPALESSHALARARIEAKALGRGRCLVVCLSGRGDKDLGIVSEALEEAAGRR